MIRTLPGISTVLWVACLLLSLLLYRPVLEAPFLFDDFGLPFTVPAYADKPIGAWLSGVRPVLMLSYWVDFQLSGPEPSTYHITNLLFHSANTVLVFLLCWGVLRSQSVQFSRALVCAVAVAVLFLVHPLQTESVAYLAGRSELVCGFFVLSALTLYCWNLGNVLSWRTAAVIHLLYIAACLSKEQGAVLPALLLAADVAFGQRSPKEALRRGARVYIPIAVIGAAALVGVAFILARSTSAGLNVGFAWYEYLMTQFGVWLLYIRLAILPFGQNADYDVPLIHSFLEPGSLLPAMVLVVAALVVWRLWRTYPVAAGGVLLFALLLAPTSSVVPIQDLAAERRMYLPLVGLLLGVAQVLVRARLGVVETSVLVGFALISGALTFERAKIWSDDLALWSDVTSKSPNKARGYTHLALAYLRSGRCSDAVALAGRIPANIEKSPELLGAFGRAYSCENKMDEAIKAFEYAAHTWPSTGRLLALASAYASAGRFGDAQATEQKAHSVPPRTPYDFLMLEALQKTRQSQSRGRDAPVSWHPGPT